MKEIVESYRVALYRARVDMDKLKLDLTRERYRAECLEEENEALRNMVAHIATGGGACL